MKLSTRNRSTLMVMLCWMVFGAPAIDAGIQEDRDAVASFEQRVALFETFFSGRPALTDKQTFKESSTGVIMAYLYFENYKIEYDVRKTDSLVAPFMGYITLSYEYVMSSKCGDVQLYGSDIREFSTIELASARRDDASCYRRAGSRMSSTFTFAYQKKQWVFRDVEGALEGALRAALGTPDGARLPVEDNNAWRILVQ